MFSKSAELYDRIYFEFKDYPSECKQVEKLIKENHPEAKSVLDVACGTGEHAKHLTNGSSFEVDGIDLDEGLITLAQDKNPYGSFIQNDMIDFNLNKTYDVVMCLFSSIGYLKTIEKVKKAIINFKSHLNDGGVILIEPWFQPENFKVGRVDLKTAVDNDFSVARMATTEVIGKLSRIHFEYLIGMNGKITHAAEQHELGLFTKNEMKKCFTDAGLIVDYDSVGLSGRGLYVAKKK